MFLLEDARGKCFFGVMVKHWHDPLSDDWPAIQGFINKMDRTTRPLDAMFKHLFVGVETGKCRQEAGMNVQDAATVGLYEITREETHVAGQTNNVDFVLSERCNNFTIVFFT